MTIRPSFLFDLDGGGGPRRSRMCWGDGRLFVLGTAGYIEPRKYPNVAIAKQGNNLFIVDQKETRYMDCSNLTLPFGLQLVADVVNRTHIAQDQAQCLLAAELCIEARRNAENVTIHPAAVG